MVREANNGAGMMKQDYDYDVVIIGGGPSGSTCSTILKKYNPGLRVLILEKEKFPRDHIGESQLPGINTVLVEMGVWDKVEAAGFPIKIGASYTWGKNNDQWDFDFFPVEQWRDEPRPAKFEGQREYTAFQVDRGIFDKILLDHAREMGVDVREETLVTEVQRDGDRITGLKLQDGSVVTGKYYVDGSGVVGSIRRAMDVGVWVPDQLKNIATWAYWENAEWALEIGVGATRVQVRSLPYGWVWFIPLGPTRTSVGVIVPAEHYKKTGLTPEALYKKGLSEQPEISKLLRNATMDGEIQSCKDWSQLCDRLYGDNWFLVGESAGFADPILAAGMYLAHQSSRDVAYTILELERGQLDADWLRKRYDDRTRGCIKTHIRFGQFWYSANGCFTDLRDYCSEIAKSAGLKLTPAQAWRWLSQGGFASDNPNKALFGLWDVEAAKGTIQKCLGHDQVDEIKYTIDEFNVFKLNLKGAKKDMLGDLVDGRIVTSPCFRRGERVLPTIGFYGDVIRVLERESSMEKILPMFMRIAAAYGKTGQRAVGLAYMLIQTLEAMVSDGWVNCTVDKSKPLLNRKGSDHMIRWANETVEAMKAQNPDVSYTQNI
ncbi:MAG: tryptophan 7-halogenase [Phycisphaeraceae bacterium]|nr:tryptophan 7-halogenase [Phycisphaerales bacterium]MCB9843763.1 tryptophan 7-halogenase [Phycisphaeraceae bacterium]